VEVWITNKRANYDQSRNIIAFMDLGEAKRIDNTALWKNTASKDLPQNKANNLYDNVKMIPDVRNIQQTNAKLSEVYGNDIVGGEDYEKIEMPANLIHRSIR
jgi:cell surface protein SprA